MLVRCPDDEALGDYCRRVEALLCRLADGPNFAHLRAFRVAAGWAKKGVPIAIVEQVLESLQDACARGSTRRGHSRRRRNGARRLSSVSSS